MRFIKIIFLLFFSVTALRAQILVKAAVDHLIPDGIDSTGNITLSVSGGTAPYTYSWSPGAITTKDLTNKAKQTYTVKVTDSALNSVTYNYQVGYKVQWSKLIGGYFRNDTIAEASFACSKNTLMPNEDGWFEYVQGNSSANIYFIGFTDSISPVYNISHIDYGFFCYFNLGMRVFESGNEQPTFYPREGDILRIERIGNVINYKMNGVLIRSISGSDVSQKTLKLTCNIGSSLSLSNIGCSFMNTGGGVTFDNYVKASPIIKHSSGPGISDGGITVIPKYPESNTYSWLPGGAVTSSITSIPFGTYSVTVSDSIANKSAYKYQVGYKVQWNKLIGGYFRNDTISGASFACSKNTLMPNEDGWFEYVQGNSSANIYFIGFTDSISPVYNISHIDYGFFCYFNLGMRVFESGNEQPTFYPREGDILRIERIGNVINYKMNGVLIRSISGSDVSQKTLKLTCNIGSSLSLSNIGCSFMNTGGVEFENYVKVYPVIKHSSGQGISDGGVNVTPKYLENNTYTWLPGGATTSSITSIPFGTYSVAVSDSSANKSTYTYQVGYKVKWSNLSGGYFRNDTLSQSSHAQSENILLPNTDGWFEFVQDKFVANDYWIGFADSLSAAYTVNDIDFGLYCYAGVYLYKYDNGNLSMIGSRIYGDVTRIERIGDVVNYKINGVLISTSTVSGISHKAFKLTAYLGTGVTMVNVGCSFYARYPMVVTPSVTNYTSESSKGSINLGITGGAPPYNIAWNGNKLPSSTSAYHQVLSSMTGLTIDSVKFKHDFDSIRSKTQLPALSPGSYSVTVYDQNNDSMALTILVPGSINSWPYVYGATTSTCSIASRTVNAVAYHYGAGYCLSQQGTYTAGTHFIVQPTVIDLDVKNQINFGVSSTTAIVSVGLQAVTDEINGGLDDLSKKTMFNFKGDASYEIVFNDAVIKTGTITATDRFSLQTNPLEEEISYYKNEVLLMRISAGPIKESTNGLIPKIVFGSVGAGLTGLQIIPRDFTPRITAIATDVSCSNLCGGTIAASGYYPIVNTPDHYEIYDASNVLKDSSRVTTVNSANFQNLCAGIYTIKYYFRIRVLTPAWLPPAAPQPLSAPITQTFEIAYKPTWANMAHVQENPSNSSLVKDNTGTQALYDAGASSENNLSANSAGWLEWLAPQTRGANVIGLSHTDAGYDPTTTNYGVLLWRYSVGSGDARVYVLVNNGVLLGVGSFTDADKFRLETGSGTNLLFKINGNTVGQFTNFQPNQTYIVDASMSIINGDLNRPRLSFGCAIQNYFAELKREMDAGYYILNYNSLKFTLDGEYTQSTLKFKVFNKMQSAVISTTYNSNLINNSILKLGDNRYSLDCNSLPVGYYTLEVTNEKNEKLYLRFKR